MLPSTMGPVSLQLVSFVGSQGWIDNLGLRTGVFWSPQKKSRPSGPANREYRT